MKKLFFATLATGALTLGYATAPYADAKETETQSHMKSFSNQQLFDELEKNGYDLNDIFTKEEIKQYKAEDQLRAGKTTFVDHGNGKSTLYLSSAYTKTIVGLGAGAVTLISNLIGGPVAASFGAFASSIASNNVDTSKGIYIKMSSVKNAAGNYVMKGDSWGYQ
ncbi:hypothetical protein ACWEWW_01990 [Staphylococcus xylosus]